MMTELPILPAEGGGMPSILTWDHPTSQVHEIMRDAEVYKKQRVTEGGTLVTQWAVTNAAVGRLGDTPAFESHLHLYVTP